MPKTKLRKMLGSADSPYIVALMRQIETQSKETLASWCLTYAEQEFLPIYEKSFPEDLRPREALAAAKAYLAGETKLPALKKLVSALSSVAKETESVPAAQAAARAVAQAAGCIYTPTHSLGMTFYGAAAIAYDRYGIEESAEFYDRIAAEECAKMLEALQAVSVPNEPNPAKINWNC